MSLCQNLRQLVARPLARNLMNGLCLLTNGGKCLRLNGETQPRCEPNRAQHAQLVLRKTQGRFTNGADYSSLQVRLTTNNVEQTTRHRTAALQPNRIEQQAIDGDIAALHLLSRIR